MIRNMNSYPLYDDGEHKVYWLGIEEAEDEKGILTNQYLVIDGNEAALIEPGGFFVFSRVLKNVSSLIPPAQIKYLLYSHQDPDVVAGLNLWFEYAPLAKIVISELWVRFIPHLAVLNGGRVIGIPDKGMDIKLGSSVIRAIPSHYLHSPGNFSFYDEKSGVLFSSDIGAAAFPQGEWYLFVEDFKSHTKLMEGFHRRYMGSTKALRAWVRSVRKLNPKAIAPQHGAIFRDKNVGKFLDWLESLEVGIEVFEKEFYDE
ncbi:oxygen-binding di-iron domain-containing protein [Pyrococcus yayanosii]|uniref:Metallo-beta-lactamase domain protein, putative n=1 Tax=Pyrococcus yayanosii (strain CH1 / JCM 16557) TaxID=529709 RepID=F8AIT0_PYRYC|nr:MBL fold metallo-hydrolase [Pyrococcus yayanosii]AEH24240.1 metallo-beta-lactamase domain protein, putative [Pyrococcus yayanosii CH1]